MSLFKFFRQTICPGKILIFISKIVAVKNKSVLLINPWIYDFSAYNLWLRPLGLLKVAAWLREQAHQVTFFDCLDCPNQDRYGCGKFSKVKVPKPELVRQVKRPYFRYGVAPERLISFLTGLRQPNEVFVGSGMTYWYPGVQEVVRLVRQVWPQVEITLGGIYAVLCPEHARQYSGADKIAAGVNGSNLYPAWDLAAAAGVIAIQSSFGCPFNCSYCGAKLIRKDFYQRDPDEVVAELKHFAPRNAAFYDDALLVNADRHIKPLLEKIIDLRLDCNFHLPNAIHARFLDKDTAVLMYRAGFKTVRLGLETSGLQRRDNKVTNEEFLRAVGFLRQAGFTAEELGVYTMFGSLDDGPEDVLRDIEFVTAVARVPVKISSYSLVPGSADHQRWLAEGRLPQDLDPLWHNNTIFPLLNRRYSLDTIRKLRRLAADRNKEIVRR